MANILNCCAFFFFFFKFESSGKNYLEAFNFSVLVDCFNKENSEKVINEAISRQYVKKKYFSHTTDKVISLRRNSLKALVIMSLFLFFLLLLLLLIVFISLALNL